MTTKCKRCKRNNCAFYNPWRANNCEALCEVYKDVYQCAFFKRGPKKNRYGEKIGEMLGDDEQ